MTGEPQRLLMFRMLNQAAEFQRYLSVPIPDEPTRLSEYRKGYALRHLAEELEELRDADTLVDELDALLDLAYVALARVAEMGLAPGPAFDEVHNANMRRRPCGTTARTEFDAVKPPGWEPPRLEALLDVTSHDLRLLRWFKRDIRALAEEMNKR